MIQSRAVVTRPLSVFAMLTVVSLSLAVAIGPAMAGDMPQMSNASAAEGGMSLPAHSGQRGTVLDGQAFQGEFGEAGKAKVIGQDSWVFRDGVFASEQCLECGFPETGYAVTQSGEGTEFVAKTQCPVTDAIITWRGHVYEDGRIEGKYTWVRERWYWTIEKDYWFRGTLKGGAPAISGQPSEETASLE